MNHRARLVCALLVVLFQACSVFRPDGERDDFIKVRGTQFIHNDRPYYYVGANVWYGCYLGSPGETGDRERLRRELDSMCAKGLFNLRILGASEESNIRQSVKPAIQQRPGKLDETLLQGLDYLLDQMHTRRMHAVMFLGNYWEWSGGMAQYNVWADGGSVPDPEDTTKGLMTFMEFSAKFYTNSKANDLYRNYVRTIVTRKNIYSGRNYSEDPTIMAWQLANEPRPWSRGPDAEKNLGDFYRWVDGTAGYIHSLDTNHLVSSGSEGTVAFGWSKENFLQTHVSPHIDYLTFHVWPKNWGWFDPRRFDETFPATEEKTMEYIAVHLSAARQLRKPIVMEEFGLGRDNAACSPGSPTTARDRYYTMVLTALYDSARTGSPLAGSNFWAWGGEGQAKHPDFVWRMGDPFLGDPPQEPQGYNAIFNADRSTVGIIRDQAFKMMELRDSLLATGRR